jgi:conjugal transfer ATP-binding protein TraC
MVRKKNKKEVPAEFVLDTHSTKKKAVFEKGQFSLKDLISPPSIDRSNESYLKVGDKYVRNFVLTGFPKNIGVGWLDYVINNEEDVDTAIYINPTDERSALDELTEKITQFESQLCIELEKGNNRNLTRLRNKIDELYQQRELIEQNYVSLFYVQVAINLYMN